MAEIGLGKLTGKDKKDDERQVQAVGLPDGELEGMVPLRSLRGLHPVKDIAALANGETVEKLDSLRLDHGQTISGFRSSLVSANSD